MNQPPRPVFCTALATPLNEDDMLDADALELHLHDQWEAGIRDVFVAGTMGAMQLLTDATYRALVTRAVELCQGQARLFVGAGDTSEARTRERLEFLNGFELDGVVVLVPYFTRFSQGELIDYYRRLADMSRSPMYLYDLPGLTGTTLEVETVCALARHRNIAGIKCSGPLEHALRIAREAQPPFRVFFAHADLIDVLLRAGYREHLDGVYALAPHWVVQLGACAMRGDWSRAADYQRRLTHLRSLVLRYRVFAAISVILNARGIPGRFAPRPARPLDAQERRALLNDPVVQRLVAREQFVPS